MANKKPIIDLKTKSIEYEQNNQTIKLVAFNKKNMTIDITIWEDGKYIKDSNIVFAHLPKSIKSKIKPL